MRPAVGRACWLRVAASQASRSAGAAAARSRPLSSAAADLDVVLCGAGVVGVACAHYLAVRGARVALIDERPALSYTSALSTECYRNWWGADPTMTAFMDRSIDLNPNPTPTPAPTSTPTLNPNQDRSIDLLEQLARASDNRFAMNRRALLLVRSQPRLHTVTGATTYGCRRGYAFLSAREDGAVRHAALAAKAGGALHTEGGHGLRYDPTLP